MRLEAVLLVVLAATAAAAGPLCGLEPGAGELARGKKKKIALFVYFADIIVKKIFVLKLIYAFVFWLVLHKAGYFLGWLASYLKEKEHDYGPQHGSYGPQYGSYGPQHGSYGPQHGYGSGPYRRRGDGKNGRS